MYIWISCRVISQTALSPNRGSKCFASMKRRCFWVECLYIGNTVACHSFASVRNVTRDRVALVLDAAASFRATMSDAWRRDIGPSRSYRSARFCVPSGAISNSRQRIAHPFPLSIRQPLPYCRFALSHSRDTLSMALARNHCEHDSIKRQRRRRHETAEPELGVSADRAADHLGFRYSHRQGWWCDAFWRLGESRDQISRGRPG